MPDIPPTLTLTKRAARPLFALLAPATFAACASASAAPSFPLCDGSGAPACGNIGQAGRQGTPDATRRAPPSGSIATPTFDIASAWPTFEVATTTLAAVGFAATTLAVLIVTEWSDEPAPVPMPSAEPPRREAPLVVAVVPAPVRPLVEVAAVRVLPSTNATDDEREEDECKRDQPARPVVDGDHRPACGNVMTKGGHRRGRR